MAQRNLVQKWFRNSEEHLDRLTWMDQNPVKDSGEQAEVKMQVEKVHQWTCQKDTASCSMYKKQTTWQIC